MCRCKAWWRLPPKGCSKGNLNNAYQFCISFELERGWALGYLILAELTSDAFIFHSKTSFKYLNYVFVMMWINYFAWESENQENKRKEYWGSCHYYISCNKNLIPYATLLQLAAVAALCVQYEADFRPNMSIVVKALQHLLNARPGPSGDASNS